MNLFENKLPLLEHYNKADKWRIAVNYVKLSTLFTALIVAMIYIVGYLWLGVEYIDHRYIAMIAFCLIVASAVRSFLWPEKVTKEYNKILS